jgi:hypothetical protein
MLVDCPPGHCCPILVLRFEKRPPSCNIMEIAKIDSYACPSLAGNSQVFRGEGMARRPPKGPPIAEEDYQIDPRFTADDDDSSWSLGSDAEEEDDEPMRPPPRRRGGAEAKGDEHTSEGESFKGTFEWGGDGSALEALQHQNAALVRDLRESKRQVRELSVLLEAVEPVPGLDADKFLDMLRESGREGMDYRDSKIVQLAKKARNLQVSLTHCKAKYDRACVDHNVRSGRLGRDKISCVLTDSVLLL